MQAARLSSGSQAVVVGAQSRYQAASSPEDEDLLPELILRLFQLAVRRRSAYLRHAGAAAPLLANDLDSFRCRQCSADHYTAMYCAAIDCQSDGREHGELPSLLPRPISTYKPVGRTRTGDVALRHVVSDIRRHIVPHGARNSAIRFHHGQHSKLPGISV